MSPEEEVIWQYLAGNLTPSEAIDELIARGLTALEAERIIEDVTP